MLCDTMKIPKSVRLFYMFINLNLMLRILLLAKRFCGACSMEQQLLGAAAPQNHSALLKRLLGGKFTLLINYCICGSNLPSIELFVS